MNTDALPEAAALCKRLSWWQPLSPASWPLISCIVVANL